MDVASIVVNVNKGKHAGIQRVVVGALGQQNHKTVGLFRKTVMDPLQNHKTVGLFRKTDMDPLQNHKTVGLFRKIDMDPLQNHKTVGLFRKTDMDPLQNHKTVGLFRKSDMDPLQNNKTIKPAFNVGLHCILKQKNRPIFMILYLSIQFRCRNKN